MTWVPVLVREADRGGRPCLRLGHHQLDRYRDFVSARARPNTTLATGYDLKVFFSVVVKEPGEVTTSDVLDFITEQRGDRGVVRLVDGESGLSARTIQRRLSSISELFAFLAACGEVDVTLAHVRDTLMPPSPLTRPRTGAPPRRQRWPRGPIVHAPWATSPRSPRSELKPILLDLWPPSAVLLCVRLDSVVPDPEPVTQHHDGAA